MTWSQCRSHGREAGLEGHSDIDEANHFRDAIDQEDGAKKGVVAWACDAYYEYGTAVG